ncbi:maestro heat-like repeat-containing protein family member 7 [Nomascus leucogenys]|uniref:maestro heat-like repeat-containing protein family member 7 n=1 Tax=Nomascus leucogenys TaxID=61853 RepID=UPI00122D9D0B|nr:maestro heat-like repeat-containing protein family member 7 [Nomascus leucogenys]
MREYPAWMLCFSAKEGAGQGPRPSLRKRRLQPCLGAALGAAGICGPQGSGAVHSWGRSQNGRLLGKSGGTRALQRVPNLPMGKKWEADPGTGHWPYSTNSFCGLRQSEREAFEFIVEFLEEEHVSEFAKLKFLRAVETLSSAVHAQADGNMDNYYPKAILAKKIETVQALDDMLQALVMDSMNPSMLILQNFLEIILPWSLLSDKVHEQMRALGTISRLLRFICNFPELSHMEEFSMSGKLMSIFGLVVVGCNHEISIEASEALHYLFKILVLQRSVKQKTETILKDLQKDFHGTWLASLQDLTLFFKKYLTPEERADMIMVSMEAMTNTSRHDISAASKMLKMILKYTIPEIGKVPEIIQYLYYPMNSITETTAQKTIKKILYLLFQYYTDEVILTLLKIEDQSQKGVCKPWEILASFPKGYEMIMDYLLQRLTPHRRPKDQEPSHRTEISPVIATRAIHELLLEPSRRMEVQSFFSSLFMALLFQISFLVVEGDAEISQDQQHIAEWMDPISSTVEALKTLIRSSGYGDYVSSIQRHGGWGLLVNPERHYDGVTLLARSLVINNCWHNRPLFSSIIRFLQDPDCKNHLTALVFLTELLQCPDVAASVDDFTTRILANWFKSEEPATVKPLLQMLEVFAKHENMVPWRLLSSSGMRSAMAMETYGVVGGGGLLCFLPFSHDGHKVRRLRILQPYVLNCCYSSNSDIVLETLLVLKNLLSHLTWQHSSSFLIQLTFTLVPFFEEVSEHLRLAAFEIYGSLLAKVKKRGLVFPLKHQILNLLVPLVLHLRDVNTDMALVRGQALEPGLQSPFSWEICRSALCHTAAVLGWSKLKAVFAEKDMWNILGALLEQETNKALWFLKQCVALFKSPQVPIRWAAVWFAGQIIQTLDLEEIDEIEEAYTALRHMQRDSDPMVSCLTTQTFHILEAKKKLLLAKSPTSCFCRRRPQRHYF